MKAITNKEHLHFNKHKLALVDSLVKEQELRDVLCSEILRWTISYKEHMANEDCDKFIAKFTELSNNETHIDEINELI